MKAKKKNLSAASTRCAPPQTPDQQIHRNQRRLEEHEEQHAVERGECPHHQTRQEHEGREILRDAHGDGGPRRDHDNQRRKSGQHGEPQRNAIDAEMVGDVQRRQPGELFDELHLPGMVVEVGNQREGQQQSDRRADECEPPRAFAGYDRS